MKYGTMIRAAVGAAVLALAVATPAWAGGFGGGGGMNPQVIQQMVLGRVQQEVGFNDDEWSVIGPKLWTVVGLEVQAGQTGGQLGMLQRFMGRGRRGAGGNNGQMETMLAQLFNNGQPIPTLQKQAELAAVLDRPDAPPQEIKAKLDEYRAAVAKAKEDLAKAQDALIQLLTVRQEGMLVQLGYLN